MTTKPFHIEVFRDGVELNGGSLDGAEMEECKLPDGTEAYMLLLPKDIVSTKLSLRAVRAPALNGAPAAKEIEAPVATKPEPAEPAPAKTVPAEPAPAKIEAVEAKPKRPKTKRKLTQRPDAAGIAPIDVRTSLDVLKLTSPTLTRLTDNGITTIGQLINKTEENLHEYGLGPSTTARIRTSLYKVGHELTVKDPKLTDICIAPMTLIKLRQHGIKTVDDLTNFSREELSTIPGCNDNQLDKFEVRLARFKKALKTE